jgi:hypothetical protein
MSRYDCRSDTCFAVINDAVYNKLFLFLCYKIGKKLLKRLKYFGNRSINKIGGIEKCVTGSQGENS